MRPLELTLDGFRSYRGRTTFDWRGRSLVGVVGPIGAGKSSILDAVAFALYGKTPTFERDTKSLIHQLADTSHVELRFEVDGQVWRVVRALRRSRAASGHQLERLASDAPDAEVIERVTKEREIRTRVEQLLGMDFDAFCRSVLLAQNRFAEFLNATPTQRNEVLKGVFGYERFDAALERARRRVAEADATLVELERRHGDLAQARAELEEAATALGIAAERAERLEQARPRIEAAAEAERSASERAAAASEHRARLESIAASLPVAERFDEELGQAERAGEALERAEREATEAESARKQAEAEAAAVAERVGDASAFAALVQDHDHRAAAAQAAAERRARAQTEAEDAERASARAAEATTQVAARRDADQALVLEAVRRVAEAQEAQHAAQHADMARTLRIELLAGEPCPVCEQPVTTPPPASRPVALARADRDLRKARDAEATARSAAEASAAALAAAEERAGGALTRAAAAQEAVRDAEVELRDAEAALAAVKSQLVDRLGEGDPHALLRARQAELTGAEAARAAAARAATDAHEALVRVRADGADARQVVGRFAAELASAWGRLDERREVSPTARELRMEFLAIGEAIVERHATAEVERAEAEAEVEHIRAEIGAALEELEIAPGADLTQALAEAAARRAACRERVDGLERTLRDAADLETRIGSARRGRDLAKRLASDLQPSRFLAYCLEEERAALAELGTVHFEELTGGAYRFTDDGRFRIVDMNAAAAERSAGSLSGGETFLASLALALALAEMVARGGGRLDAFFLDEGFGSLDPEHLERAMDGIGHLVAGDGRRLVVLVSHVEQMRQTLEDLIVLDKDGATGDTRVISGARPAVDMQL